MFRTPREAGMLLRRLREDAGMSQGELAERAMVSRRWLINFENGKSSVDMSKVMDSFAVVGRSFNLVAVPPQTGDEA